MAADAREYLVQKSPSKQDICDIAARRLTEENPRLGGCALPRICPVELGFHVDSVSDHDDPEQMAAVVLEKHGNDCHAAREFALRQRRAACNKELVFFWNAVAQIIREGHEGA